tara:strand:+ start:51 stop:461 length:411 start_codon:yes stop_codon:yes gene_type:complete
MESSLIIYPGFAVVCLTFLLYIKNRIEVGKAFSEKSIKGSYLKFYQDKPPEHVEISRQTLKNQFELPVLFYFLITLLYVKGNITQLDLILAWIFAVSRFIHAYIRLSSNYVPNRAKMFIVGLIALLAGWINLIIGL